MSAWVCHAHVCRQTQRACVACACGSNIRERQGLRQGRGPSDMHGVLAPLVNFECVLIGPAYLTTHHATRPSSCAAETYNGSPMHPSAFVQASGWCFDAKGAWQCSRRPAAAGAIDSGPLTSMHTA